MEGDILSQILRSWCGVVTQGSVNAECLLFWQKEENGQSLKIFLYVSLGGFIKLSRESNVFFAVGCFL